MSELNYQQIYDAGYAASEKYHAHLKAQRIERDPQEATSAYELIDMFLRNNLGDTDYAEYSKALENVWCRPHEVHA